MVPVWRVRRVLPPRSGLIRQEQKERIYWWRKSIKKTTRGYAWYRKVRVSRHSASASVWKRYPPSSSGFLGKVNQGKSLRANWWASNYYGPGFWTNEAPRECIRRCLWHPNCWSNCASNCHAVDELWTCWYRLSQWPPNSSFWKFLFPGNYSEGLQIPAVWQKIILPDGELLDNSEHRWNMISTFPSSAETTYPTPCRVWRPHWKFWRWNPLGSLDIEDRVVELAASCAWE